MPPDKTLSDLAAARIDKAARCLQSADNAIANNDFETAANRSYYCIFNSMKAVLAFDGFRSKNHGEVIGAFRKDYIKTGIFPVEYSDVIRYAFETRNCCDYEDFYIAVENDVASQVENAKTFLEAVEKYVGERIQKA
jgi:uncharacterized protein (UPF0332 family)